ncbi:MAG: cyclic pyranopterin monophosphate synthase MoaC [Gemmatimonadota bacterium]|nr:cyclic pyranopterin monophosphate synthase MoaC [Gemmatimonadota bacterium]MDH3368261.1 cyclic pyranopterin monophosphate synthase MoaC [Gemmatimonadota bacterium]MDH3477399.1 cyclic pyranopterin monophosphate synthase MoaC [Gemmatimonadota bacterium]MDH3569287.1 cyclic pyranopterin monophosphate synthase MoaC [Gemmatimonadota bacterium]MDH5551446.1 cyclic pyranopterin monophosphate synthase MoaC [Gemmatimonadota bacterium]
MAVTLSHLDEGGRARMVDVSGKPETKRLARAEGWIRISPEAFALVERNSGPKGDVVSTAEMAGVMAAKRAAELIPLCHPLGLDHVAVRATLDPQLAGVRVEAEVRTVGRTGVEMEALTAVSVALLTVYDMVKSTGYAMEIGPIRLLEKAGGRSGHWTNESKDTR